MTEACEWSARCSAQATHEVARQVAPGETDRRGVCPRHLEVAQALGYQMAQASQR